jgi:hypothetical protein
LTVQVPPAVGSSGQFIDSIVLTSSTNRQIIVVGDPTSTGNLLGINASGQVTVVQSATVRSLSSGTVTLSSATSLSSGTVTLSSAPTVNVSSGVITLSSATSLSSGTVTLSSNPTIVSASSGVVQVLTSGTLIIVSASSGLIQLTSAISISSGTVTLSSSPTTVSASSGTVGTILSTAQTWTVFAFNASSSNSVTSISTGPHVFYGWNVGNQTTGIPAAVKIYDSTAPTVGSTTNLKLTIPIPGSTGGAGNNLMLGQGISVVTGLAFVITRDFASTSTGVAHSAGDVVGSLYYI